LLRRVEQFPDNGIHAMDEWITTLGAVISLLLLFALIAGIALMFV
jgi:hypothetical protein